MKCMDRPHKQNISLAFPFTGLSLCLSAVYLTEVTHHSAALGLVSSRLSALSSFPWQKLKLGEILAPAESGSPQKALFWEASLSSNVLQALTHSHMGTNVYRQTPAIPTVSDSVCVFVCVSEQEVENFTDFSFLVNITWLLSPCDQWFSGACFLISNMNNWVIIPPGIFGLHISAVLMSSETDCADCTVNY